VLCALPAFPSRFAHTASARSGRSAAPLCPPARHTGLAVAIARSGRDDAVSDGLRPHENPPPGSYEVIYPKNLSSQCCGMMFNSRGLKDAAAKKGAVRFLDPFPRRLGPHSVRRRPHPPLRRAIGVPSACAVARARSCVLCCFGRVPVSGSTGSSALCCVCPARPRPDRSHGASPRPVGNPPGAGGGADGGQRGGQDPHRLRHIALPLTDQGAPPRLT
jgi:hypothetical protein